MQTGYYLPARSPKVKNERENKILILFIGIVDKVRTKIFLLNENIFIPELDY